ncbi:unnamed protein product [Mesocestoides corti]|uniref:Vesicle transport protein n=1 Tax=Mesocestoides corti TaxID=53468 RepID=A0A0R3UC71_MESCO|nr:unnamed protein product [Mesocestoides corti]
MYPLAYPLNSSPAPPPNPKPQMPGKPDYRSTLQCVALTSKEVHFAGVCKNFTLVFGIWFTAAIRSLITLLIDPHDMYLVVIGALTGLGHFVSVQIPLVPVAKSGIRRIARLVTHSVFHRCTF